MNKSLKPSWFFAFAVSAIGMFLIVTDAAACEQVRAALDIGSTTTKMVVARIDYCEDRVVQVLAPAPGAKLEHKVEYAKGTVDAEDGRKVFKDDVILQGLAAIQDLEAVALEHGAEAFSAVATSAFRVVDRLHAQNVLERIRRQTGFRVDLISQEEEARLGFFAAALKVGLARERLVVWDIGGGSMQMSYWDQRASSVVSYLGTFANEAMHRFLIEVVQGQNYRETTSPNPILKLDSEVDRVNEFSQAIRKAQIESGGGIPPGLRERLRALQNEVIGIGGVHYFSNCELMVRFSEDGCSFTHEELRGQARRHAHLTDRELVEAGLSASIEFAPFGISGAALTVGVMNAVNIEQVRTIEVDMSDGILVDPDFWDVDGRE